MIIKPDNKNLQYYGRIDFEDMESPEFVYPSSSIRIKVSGSYLRIKISNKCAYWDNWLGVIIDGKQEKVKLPKEEGQIVLSLAENMEDKLHDILIFKRQDSCHTFRFYGFEVEDGAKIEAPDAMPKRRIEVYGDSVSAGEVSEAVEYTGKEDPNHNGEYSNSYYSYAWMLARKLNAGIHNISQGGIALLPGTGWFMEPDYIGMEEVYDKIQYQPLLGKPKPWDFAQYTPHVVLVAIGQNDSHPEDYMADDYDCEKSLRWRRHYKTFIEKLRDIYPKSVIILATTILNHHANWDKSIEEISLELQDSKIFYFKYSNNGCGTPGHIRISEAEQMAEELEEFIVSLGKNIWKGEKNDGSA